MTLPGWSAYQEEVAAFYRELGLSATTNETLAGVRTTHDIDVVVRSRHTGFDVLWLIECKAWKDAIPKEKVLALRTIVEDLGADRGFIMAESGYQSGALQAARYANVMLTSLADLKETLAHELGMSKLRAIRDRVRECRERYWSISKSDRIDLDLRPDVGTYGYSGDVVVRAVDYILGQAMFGGFPIVYDRTLAALSFYGGGGLDPVEPDDPAALHTPSELYDVLDEELSNLERRLDGAEATLRQRENQ